MKLALNMIVKNEAENIEDCILSVKPIVDEVVILDTGSTDNTVNIAKSLGANVVNFMWRDDFALARNEALSNISTDWALVLDADERIAKKDHDSILTIINNKDVDGYLMRVRNYLNGAGYDQWKAVKGQYGKMEKGYPGYREHYVLRLFRNCGYLRWDGRVHENLISVDPNQKWSPVQSDVVIHHYGKVADEARLNRKKDEYLALNKKKANERPGDAKAQFELGVQLHELGMNEEAIEPFYKAFNMNEEYKEALYFIGNIFHKLGRYSEAEDELDKFLSYEPSHCDAIVTLACVKNEKGDADSALNLLEKAINLKADMFNGWYNKGVILLKLSRYKEAEPVFENVLKLMPDYEPAMFGKWHVDIALGKFETAESNMKKWLEDNIGLKKKVIGAAKKFMENGKFEIIIRAIGPVIELLDNAIAYSALGAAYLSAQNIGEAEYNLEKAIACGKKGNEARVNLAQLKHVYKNDISSALKLYKEALIYEPDNIFVKERIKLLNQNSRD